MIARRADSTVENLYAEEFMDDSGALKDKWRPRAPRMRADAGEPPRGAAGDDFERRMDSRILLAETRIIQAIEASRPAEAPKEAPRAEEAPCAPEPEPADGEAQAPPPAGKARAGRRGAARRRKAPSARTGGGRGSMRWIGVAAFCAVAAAALIGIVWAGATVIGAL